MFYVITPAPKFINHQMTLEELFSGKVNFHYTNCKGTNTVTYRCDGYGVPRRMSEKVGVDIDALINRLKRFNEDHKDLFLDDMSSLYREFYIPKKTHGFRKIDAPNKELADALRELKQIFEWGGSNSGGLFLYHTAAFAYIKGRSTVDAVKRHQANESMWFGKFDLSNFFGNTTKEFVLKQLSMIYPYNIVMRDIGGRALLSKALDLAFLDGGLPQGTPFSPTITNLIMVPIDHELARKFHQLDKQRFIYTRYADDFLVSSKYDFNVRKIEQVINEVLQRFDAPYRLNAEKTRYGSRSGQNWNLGVMLNKDNQITVGHKRKRELKAAITSYILDKRNGNKWELGDVQVLQGNISYVMMIEKECTLGIIKKLNQKFGVDIMASIKADLKGRQEDEVDPYESPF